MNGADRCIDVEKDQWSGIFAAIHRSEPCIMHKTLDYAGFTRPQMHRNRSMKAFG
jgi:hypothetical protein